MTNRTVIRFGGLCLASVAAFEALAPVRRGTMRLALMFAVVAAIAMMLGLMRWPSIHWHLA